MTDIALLPAKIRESFGKGAARSLRRQGQVPAIIYGAGKQPISIAVEEKEVTRLYRKKHFISTVIHLDIEGNKISVLPKQIDLHPISDVVRHLDFVFLEKEIQKVEVPIVFEGKEKALGVKRGGFFNIIRRTITVFCPVDSIPSNIIIDVNNFIIGQSIKASKLELPQGCVIASKKDFTIASITGRGGKSDGLDEASTEAAPSVATTPAPAVAAKAKTVSEKSKTTAAKKK